LLGHARQLCGPDKSSADTDAIVPLMAQYKLSAGVFIFFVVDLHLSKK
jgi:hypothetical protein